MAPQKLLPLCNIIIGSGRICGVRVPFDPVWLCTLNSGGRVQLAWWSCDGHPVTKEEPWNQSQATQTGVTQVPLDIAEQLLGREKRSLAARIRTDIAWGVSAGRISSDDVRALKPFGPVPDVVVKWYWEQLERGVFDEAPSLRALVRLAG